MSPDLSLDFLRVRRNTASDPTTQENDRTGP